MKKYKFFLFFLKIEIISFALIINVQMMQTISSKKQVLIGLLDRSGSMRGKEEDTIGGWNALVSQMKSDAQGDSIVVSLYVFDHELTCIYEDVNIQNVREITHNDYQPRGQTAIDDALGITLTKYINHKNECSMEFDSCIIALSTDGQENASTNFNNLQVSNLISQGTPIGITVLYLAANQDAIAAAATRGISSNHALNYNTSGNASMSAYQAVGRVASSARSNPTQVDGFTLPERQASQPIGNTYQQYSPVNYSIPPPDFAPPRVARSRSFHDRRDALNNIERETVYPSVRSPNPIRPRGRGLRSDSSPLVTPPPIERNNATNSFPTGPDAV